MINAHTSDYFRALFFNLLFVTVEMLKAKTLPAAVLGQRDVLGAAETGSGKTLAFGIPILHRILEYKEQTTGR